MVNTQKIKINADNELGLITIQYIRNLDPVI